MPPARRSALPGLAALSLLLAGCAKDLELPPRSTAPVLVALSPPAAYAGQLLRLRGTGLDPDAGANVVTFAAATARGLRFDGDALVVRVPEDAGSGPLLVTNGRGTSAQLGAFEYLGLGEPRRRGLTDGMPVLHASKTITRRVPSAVHGIGGAVFMDSAVYPGLLAAGDGTFETPRADLSAAADWKGALFTAELATTTAALWRIDAATGARTGPVTIPFYPTALVTVRGVDVVVALSSSDSTLAAFDLDALALVTTAAPAELGSYEAAADVRDGARLLVAGYAGDAADPFASAPGITLSLLDLSSLRATGALPAPVVLTDASFPAPVEGTRLAVAVADRADPVGIATGDRLAAVTVDGGDLLVADLDGAPRFVGTVETFSTSYVGGLAGAATRPVVLATRPDDGLSVGVDLVARTLLWSVPGNAPDAASASGDTALVAHAGDNDVSVVNLANGWKVARVTFDVDPRQGNAARYTGALAFLPRDPAVDGSADLLFFVSGRFPALLRFSLGARTASCALRGPGLGPLVASPAEPALWVARSGAPAELDLLRERGAAAPLAIPLPGVAAVSELAPRGATLALAGHLDDPGVGAGGALSVLDAGGLRGTVATGALGVAGLGWSPDGSLWAVPRPGATDTAQLWDAAAIGTGGTPDVSHAFPTGTALSAVWLEDGLWLLGQGPTRPEALLLGPDLAVARTVPLADAPGAAMVSPNGRLLVERLIGGTAGQTVLRFFRADPDVGFPLLDTLVVDGVVEGLTFDGTGERLWVLTRSPDRILLVD